jgi:hypothetical protein
MMKNLNEPHKRDEIVQKPEAEVVPFQRATVNTSGPLLSNVQVEELRTKWNSIQTNFVDQPRKAVEDADNLVASAIKQIEEVFAAQRANLEKKWQGGDNVSTEDLRVALQRYRDFFDHLLSLKRAGM